MPDEATPEQGGVTQKSSQLTTRACGTKGPGPGDSEAAVPAFR